jgi:hypothetical protein
MAETKINLTDEQIKMFFGEKTKQSPTGRIFVRVYGRIDDLESGVLREFIVSANEIVNPDDKSDEAVRRMRIAERAKMIFMGETGARSCKIYSVEWDYEGTSSRWLHNTLYDVCPEIIAKINKI